MRSTFGLVLFSFGLLLGCQTLNKKTLGDLNSSSEVQSVQFKPKWVFDTLAEKNIGFRKVNFFTPLLYKGHIIVGNSIDGLSSYSEDSKYLDWRLKIPFGVEAAALLVEDKLYFGGLDGVFYSVHASTGDIIWKFDTKAEIVAQASFENGTIYFNNGSNSLFALDAQTGRQNWVYTRQEINSPMSIRGASRPAYSNGAIYSGFSDGSLVSINAKTGTQLWEVSLNKKARFKDIDATPVIEGDQIFMSSYDDHLYCLSKSNGTILWKYKSGGSTAPLIVGQKLFFSTSQGEFVSLKKSNGELIWKKTSMGGIGSEPVSFKGYVIFGESQGKLLALDLLTGEEKASFDPGKGIMSKPGLGDGSKVYFISGEANFYEVDLVNQTKGMIPYLIN